MAGARRSAARRRSGPGLVLAALALSASAHAQMAIPGERPSDVRPAPPGPREPGPEAPILPPYAVPETPDAAVASGQRVLVREIRVVGNTAVDDDVLRAIVAPFEDRPLSWSDLQDVRERLSRAYVERGYVTSGAVLPEQVIAGGVVELRVVEGGVEEIVVETDGRLRPAYVRSRLRRGITRPVDIARLEERLRALQLDPNVARISARLEPAERAGASRLRVSVAETARVAVAAEFDNHRSPPIGSLGGTLFAELGNLSGWGDATFARFTGSEGLRQVEAQTGAPVTPWDTALALRYRGSFAEIVDDAFQDLEIESEAHTFGAELRQPFHRTAGAELAGTVRFERRHTDSRIGLVDLGLPTLASDDGETDSSVLRFGLDALLRSRRQALSLRSLLSWGVDAFGATTSSGGLPDGRFVAWLGQAQWAGRLPWQDLQLLARVEAQLTDDRLLPNEQYALGGRFTVRGYRENAVVRDRAVLGSLELRWPLLELPAFDAALELVPFFDAGHAWDAGRDPRSAETLVSAGIGARARVARQGEMELFWGHPFDALPVPGERDPGLQDEGLHFQLRLLWP